MTDLGRVHSSRSHDLDLVTFYRILRLRVDVFVVEQACPYPELDGRDLEPSTRHLWIAGDEGEVLATLRILQDHQSRNVPAVHRIGRVCTEPAWRRRGLVTALMTAALSDVGRHRCVLEAQTHLMPMYARFGFVVDGDEYDADGIPHVPMVRAGG